MIINEHGLVQALKRAYKVGGYNIMNVENQVAIYSDEWYLRCDWKKFPRKALAIIVEHIGMIPSGCDALNVNSSCDPQVIIPEMVGQALARWVNAEESSQADMCCVIFLGQQIFQSAKEKKCYGVNPMSLAMLERDAGERTSANKVGENRLLWCCEGELVILGAVRPIAENSAPPWVLAVWDALESVDLCKKADTEYA